MHCYVSIFINTNIDSFSHKTVGKLYDSLFKIATAQYRHTL